MPPVPTSASEALAERLPFAVDDYEAANAAFVRWHTSRADAALEVVLIWAYCYAQRYFTQKFVCSRTLQPSDYDTLVTKGFASVRKYHANVRDPARFAHWVSVVYKHTFVRYVSRHHESVELQAERVPDPAVTTPWREHDQRVIQRAVQAALRRLPEFLQEVARMKLVDQMEYEAIAERTGHPVPTVRAYVCKVMARLRQDPDIQAVRNEYLE